MAKLKKKSDVEASKISFLQKSKEKTEGAQAAETKPVQTADESLVPDPDKQ